MRKLTILRSLGAAGVALLLLAGIPYKSLAASGPRIVTSSGDKVVSIFQGLKPSPYAHYQSFRSRRGPPGDRLSERHLGARYRTVQCVSCPSTTKCADHYQNIVDASGCVDPLGGCALPLHNAVTDSTKAPYNQGAQDSFCGEYCCEDAEDCDNP
jgi:hypothetical protein